MAKQEELRKLVSRFAQQVRTHHEAMKQATEPQNERRAERSMREAENRIFSFFDQMRKTIDGLSADVSNKATANAIISGKHDAAVEQIRGLLQQCAAFEHTISVLNATNEKLRKGGTPVAEDTFVPLDLARKDGLEVLVGMPIVGKWLPATYIGHTPSGFHVVEATGHGIVAITDAAAGLRHRVKQKTVTLWANYSDNALKHPAFDGCVGWLYATEDIAKNYSPRKPATPHAVTITVAE